MAVTHQVLWSCGLAVLFQFFQQQGCRFHALAFRFFGLPRRAAVLVQPLPKFETVSFAGDKQYSTTISRLPIFLSNISEEPDDVDDEFAEANDGEAVQSLFAKYCDSDGLMTKSVLTSIQAVSELLETGDLLIEELEAIWEAAPKFPDLLAVSNNERIDVDSFIQIYRDIDDLFEDDADDNVANETPVIPASNPTPSAELMSIVETDTIAGGANTDGPDITLENELESIFETICDKSGLISKDKLRTWDEVAKLVDDRLLGEEEFEDIWNQTPKSPGSSEQLDVDGFLSFNVALDDLFEFSDDVGDELSQEESITDSSDNMVVGDDLPPSVLFAALANNNFFVGMNELKKWSELQDMLAQGDLLMGELKDIFDGIPKAEGTTDELDERGFTLLFEAIENLFEDDEDDLDNGNSPPKPLSFNDISDRRNDLLYLLGKLNSDPDRLPCGLETTEVEERQVIKLVTDLERENSNLIRQRQGKIQTIDLAGTWELLYTSSSAMKFNKGLSGLGGSFPNGRFAGLKQTLNANKYMTDVEYTERIEVNPSNASFDVKVTGDWDLRSSVSLFTGEPSIILTIEPGKVTYGPTSTRADHWKSLGPMNMLDITYLDQELRIMRGNTSTDTIFVLRRSL